MSLEKLFEDILKFCKKFFLTLYYSIIKIENLEKEIDKPEKSIIASLLFLIFSYFFFFSIVSEFDFNNPLEQVRYFFEQKTFGQRLIFVVPFVLITELFIKGVAILQKKENRNYFEEFLRYNIGGFVFLFSLLGFFDSYLNFITDYNSKFEPFIFYSLLSPLFLIFIFYIFVTFKVSRIKTSKSFRAYYFIYIITYGFTFYYFVDILVEKVISKQGELEIILLHMDRLNLTEDSTVHSTINSIAIDSNVHFKCDLLFKNSSKQDCIINKDSYSLKFEPEEKDSIDKNYSFVMKLTNTSIPNEIVLLKPMECKQFFFRGDILSSQLKYFIKNNVYKFNVSYDQQLIDISPARYLLNKKLEVYFSPINYNGYKNK